MLLIIHAHSNFIRAYSLCDASKKTSVKSVRKKRKKKLKKPNGVAKALHTPLYRQRIKPSKKGRVSIHEDANEWFWVSDD